MKHRWHVTRILLGKTGTKHFLEWQEWFWVKNLKTGQTLFQGQGNVTFQVWKDKRHVQTETMNYKPELVMVRKDRKSNLETKKLCCVLHCNTVMKGVSKASKLVSHVLRKSKKTVLWLKKRVALYVVNWARFNALFVYKTMNTSRKISARGRKVMDIRNNESNHGPFWWTAIAREATNAKKNKT
jgi:hypothetical protein